MQGKIERCVFVGQAQDHHAADTALRGRGDATGSKRDGRRLGATELAANGIDHPQVHEFERQLCDFGAVTVKFWIQIDRKEQLRRFRARENTPHKNWKITEDDWRNRRKWRQYNLAIVDMLRRTSTTYAPWTILEGTCKLHARIKALETVATALEAALARQ